MKPVNQMADQRAKPCHKHRQEARIDRFLHKGCVTTKGQTISEYRAVKQAEREAKVSLTQADARETNARAEEIEI